MSLLAYIPAALTCVALAFYIANLVALRSWRKQAVPPAAAFPVSILKPLMGCDPEMHEAFRWHCLQEYEAPYEIIFGVNDAQDEAVPFVQRLQAEFPQHSISLVVCSDVLGANRKVSNLVQMVRHARYAHVLVSDSDITVPSGYLSGVMRWFVDPQVGLVTCLYRARSAKTIWSKLESLGVLLDFMPGALTARIVEGRVRFGLGSTLAVSRTALEKIGGFETLVNYLADDYELANAIVKAGYQVVVPVTIVETHVRDYNFREFWDHQLRWGRTVRSSRFGGYWGLIVTFGLFWAVVWAIVSAGSAIALAAITAVLVLRWILLGAYAAALEDVHANRSWWLVPLRDLISPIVWFCSIAGNKIVWRGETFRLRNGNLFH
ncbi:MAG TPA: bacteriohopanetetrol glucosamine biosynthesis glycosyltransferase HpnI [Tepidisphaeraceae bacterium]|nr:bacteriohopanetetrol glucosamine biosynthesis glycosyltransferase HpnI [Tepidisphaeraceae bacterium]